MITAIVLAGGQSRRLNQDKRRLRLHAGGPTLLEQVVATVRPLCTDLVVVLNDPAEWPQLNARLVPDRIPNGGALGGLYSGLIAATQPYALVVAADLPLLNVNLLRYLLEYPRLYDVLLPRSPFANTTRNSEWVEPLHAIYSRACLPALRLTLARGTRRITNFLKLVQVTHIAPKVLHRFDPAGHSFLNINTPADITRCHAILHQTAE